MFSSPDGGYRVVECCKSVSELEVKGQSTLPKTELDGKIQRLLK